MLAAHDRFGLLAAPASAAEIAPEELDDDALLTELGADTPKDNDVSVLKHVVSREEKRAAEEIKDGSIPDFIYEPTTASLQKAGKRKSS